MTNVFSAYSGVAGDNGLLLNTHIETLGKLALIVQPDHVNGMGRRRGAWRWTVEIATDFSPARVAFDHVTRTSEDRARKQCIAAGRDALHDAIERGLDK